MNRIPNHPIENDEHEKYLYEKPKKVLKPCPFCGGEVILQRLKTLPYTFVWTPKCSKCPCVLKRQYKLKKEAIFYWNRRMI